MFLYYKLIIFFIEMNQKGNVIIYDVQNFPFISVSNCINVESTKWVKIQNLQVDIVYFLCLQQSSKFNNLNLL